MQTCLAKAGADLCDWVGAASSPCCHVSRHQGAHRHIGIASFCLQAWLQLTSGLTVGVTAIRQANPLGHHIMISSMLTGYAD